MVKNEDIRFGAFINGAINYCDHADILLHSPARNQNANDPVYLLYFQAAELVLKGFLVYGGEKAPSRWRHNLPKIYADCLTCGLVPTVKRSLDLSNVIGLLHSANKNEGLRYFTLDFSTKPELEWTSEIVRMLIGLVVEQTGHQFGPAGPAVKLTATMSRPHKLNPATTEN